MANRVMAQKTLKMKRQRRAWFKGGNIKSGIQPSNIVLDEYKLRARGLAFDEEMADKIAAHLLGQKQPFKGVPPARLEAIQRRAKEEASLPDGVDHLCFKGPGPCNNYQESRIWTNVKRNAFVVVHDDYRLRIQRRSIAYSSLEILLTRWNMDKITWTEKTSISSPRKT